jgi:hypothetical protein
MGDRSIWKERSVNKYLSIGIGKPQRKCLKLIYVLVKVRPRRPNVSVDVLKGFVTITACKIIP